MLFVNEELHEFLDNASVSSLANLTYEYACDTPSEFNILDFALYYYGVKIETLNNWCDFTYDGVYTDIKDFLYYRLIDIDLVDIYEIANYGNF